MDEQNSGKRHNGQKEIYLIISSKEKHQRCRIIIEKEEISLAKDTVKTELDDDDSEITMMILREELKRFVALVNK